MHLDREEMPIKYLVRDNDSKFSEGFDQVLRQEGIKVVPLPIRSPDLNAFAERAIQSLKHECLNHFVILGAKHLDYLVQEYVDHYNHERPHSSTDALLPPCHPGNWRIHSRAPTWRSVRCRTRLGGLLRSYERRAA